MTLGIPDLMISDNGAQFSADSSQAFVGNYGFVPQENRETERAF